MRVLVAFDKFKDALDARAAGEAAASALRRKHPDWSLDLCPLTDGGEGFCETLTGAARGDFVTHPVTGPRGAPVNARVGLAFGRDLPAAAAARLGLPPDGLLTIHELAATSGLALLPMKQRDPWQTTTFGIGQQLRTAAAINPHAILLGIGGSATNDLGLGALAALGFQLLNARGRVVAPPVPATWEQIVGIERGAAPELPPLFLACDVDNPLLGPRGATATFGPQKGLKPVDVPRLETQMARMATLLAAAGNRPLSLADTPGAGAAGGIAFGLMAACGARLVPGFELVSDWLDLPARLAAADLILTGEGRFDATSLTGKGPGSIVRESRRLGKPVHVFAGSLGVPADTTTHVITPPDMPLDDALPLTAELIEAAVERAWCV
jgi:glycerate kinase